MPGDVSFVFHDLDKLLLAIHGPKKSDYMLVGQPTFAFHIQHPFTCDGTSYISFTLMYNIWVHGREIDMHGVASSKQFSKIRRTTNPQTIRLGHQHLREDIVRMSVTTVERYVHFPYKPKETRCVRR